MFKKSLIIFAFLLTFVFVFKFLNQPIHSAPSTSVKDTLSSSQLSFVGRLGVGVSAGDSLLRIYLTAGTAPSITTNNLFVGDTLGIGTSNGGSALVTFTVKDIANTGSFEISGPLGAGSTGAGTNIIATRSANHIVSWTPQSNATGGFWQFLIKATNRAGEINNDGIPDQQGFDLGATTPTSTANGLGTRLKTTDVTCPNFGAGTNAFSVGTTVGVVSGGTTNYYHVITCQLGAGNTNQVGVGYSAAIGLDAGSQLINPSPSTNARVEGSADVYTFFVRHLDNLSALIDADTTQGKIAVVESVRVTATVDPSLTFSIGNSGVGVGATPCGLGVLSSAAANTTGDAVAFGSIGPGGFNDLAQTLTAITNSNGGYVVTAFESGQMRNIQDGTTLPDTTCPANSCTISSPALWTTTTASGWGYTLHNLSVGQSIFSYQQGYKPFGNGNINAQQVMRNPSTPLANEQVFVCYRLTASSTQDAGNYETKITYTATSTF